MYKRCKISLGIIVLQGTKYLFEYESEGQNFFQILEIVVDLSSNLAQVKVGKSWIKFLFPTG